MNQETWDKAIAFLTDTEELTEEQKAFYAKWEKLAVELAIHKEKRRKFKERFDRVKGWD